MIIQYEIFKAALHLVQGLEFDPKNLSVDVARECVPQKSYLMHENTVKRFIEINFSCQISFQMKPLDPGRQQEVLHSEKKRVKKHFHFLPLTHSKEILHSRKNLIDCGKRSANSLVNL